MDIDFVIPWVDGSDPEWQERKRKVSGDHLTDDSIDRYRDWGLLPYWFRGVEKFAPWVRYIWFICDQEPPKWLNREHSKLRIVKHEDYLPEKYLPAFSANPIELNLHRIRGLSEHFVYFNDDMYLISAVNKTFFFQKGLPVDSAILTPVSNDSLSKGNGRIFTIPLNNSEYINRDYSIRNSFKKNLIKWLNPCYGKGMLKNILCCCWPRFVGFDEPHLPQSFLKSSYIAAWNQYYEILDSTSRHHFRDDRDVNQWLIREKQLVEGRFVARRPIRDGFFYDIQGNIERIHNTISKQRVSVICLNDRLSIGDNAFSELRLKLIKDFETILGDKSSFEN